jgi:hypothetical protein
MTDDFLVRRREKNAPSDDAQFTWFGPAGTDDRFRFLVTREQGDVISLLPTRDGRFKKGLVAWRWDAAEGGEPTTYRTVKTTARRIDLRREGGPAAD